MQSELDLLLEELECVRRSEAAVQLAVHGVPLSNLDPCVLAVAIVL